MNDDSPLVGRGSNRGHDSLDKASGAVVEQLDRFPNVFVRQAAVRRLGLSEPPISKHLTNAHCPHLLKTRTQLCRSWFELIYSRERI
jgi:hypothetical protein